MMDTSFDPGSTDLREAKRLLRKTLREKRKMLSLETLSETDRLICENLIRHEAFQKARCIFCYIGVGEEIRTERILEAAWAAGKKVTVPRCEPDGWMTARRISSFSEVKTGFYGLMEPDDSAPIITPEEIDLAVVPCLACDSQKKRIGQGGGYYDRFLPGRSFVALALCRRDFLMDELPCDDFDESVDGVITEKVGEVL